MPVENEVLVRGRHSGEGWDRENPYISDSTIAQTSPLDPRLRGNDGCIVALGPQQQIDQHVIQITPPTVN